MPASARIAISSTETYLVAATTVTPGPTSALTRSYRSRSASGDIAHRSLTTGETAVASVREEALGSAGGAGVEPIDAGDAGRAQSPLGGGREVEAALPDEAEAERRTDRRGDVLPH